MLRSDFEQHPIWSTLDDINVRLGTVRERGDTAELSTVGTIGFYRDHIRSFRDSSASNSPFFVDAMLTPVRSTLLDVLSSLDSSISEGIGSSHLDNARLQIESALVQMAPWPRALAKGGQVQQLSTLYEDLLERQRLDLDALAKTHERLRAEIEAFRVEIAEAASDARSELSSLSSGAADVAATVNGEKARIDELIASGVQQLAEMRTTLDTNQQTWQTAQEKEFEKKIQPFVDGVKQRLDDATESLARLRATEADFDNLTAAAATDKLAGHFGNEARAGRRAGIALYIAGGVLIIAAAIPLLLLLIPGNLALDPDVRWEQLAIRAGVGVACASAATVAIRLGGRFFTSANVSKRMEIDLKTFGPFLAGVSDMKEVDKARIALVERALGRVNEGSTPRDDSVSVGGMTQLVEAITKSLGR